MDKTLTQECEAYNESIHREAVRKKAAGEYLGATGDHKSPERSNYKNPSYQSYLDTHGLNSQSNGGY
jgi:hypothetical protein